MELLETLVGDEDYEFANMFMRLRELDLVEEEHLGEGMRSALDDIGYTYEDGEYYQNDISDYSAGDSDGDWG